MSKLNKEKQENRFYVYAYLDPRKPGKYVYGEYSFDYEPFYVGKGTGKRDVAHLLETKENTYNTHKVNKIKKIIKETSKNPIVIKLQYDLCEQDAFELEIDYIKFIGRINLKNGPLTNKTDGGDGGLNPSLETRKKMSVNTTGENNPNFGKKASPEKLKKMSDGMKKAYENNPEIRIAMANGLKKAYENNPEMRKHLSEIRKGRSVLNDMINLYGKDEAERRMKIIIDNRTKKNQKSILQYSIDGVFLKEWSSLKSAANFYKISIGSISLCINEDRLTCNGYIWRPKINDVISETIIPNKRKEKFTPILQYDLNGNFLKKWDSIKQIFETHNYLPGAISSACNENGKKVLKRVYGFLWRKFENDNFPLKIEQFILSDVHNVRAVIQFDLDMKFIREYKSISEAERINGFKNSAISMVCNNKRKKACGFIWKYAD